MKQYREEGRPVVYIDETYNHSFHIYENTWCDESSKGFRRLISKGAIVQVGWENGFIPKAKLIF